MSNLQNHNNDTKKPDSHLPQTTDESEGSLGVTDSKYNSLWEQ